MRPVARNTVLAILAVIALLLALGALPGYLRAGDPYYLTATPTAEGGPAVNASDVSFDRFRYTAAALSNATNGTAGRSSPYWRGPVGLKGAFTHSPFDELDALRQQYPTASEDDGVRVRHDGAIYRLSVTQDDD